MAPILGYWDLRVMAEPIRLLLKYVGVDFEDKRYEVRATEEEPIDRSEWLAEKFTLGLPFPNLPYYIDEDVKLTQSRAIMRYLARKHGLDARSEEERQLLDVLESVAEDILWKLGFGVANRSDFEEAKGEYLKTTLPDFLRPLSSFLAGKSWFLGDRITYVDFYMYERLDYNRMLEPSCFDEFPDIKAFMDRFDNLPNIKEYMESGRFKRLPIFSRMAKWGY